MWFVACSLGEAKDCRGGVSEEGPRQSMCLGSRVVVNAVGVHRGIISAKLLHLERAPVLCMWRVEG